MPSKASCDHQREQKFLIRQFCSQEFLGLCVSVVLLKFWPSSLAFFRETPEKLSCLLGILLVTLSLFTITCLMTLKLAFIALYLCIAYEGK